MVKEVYSTWVTKPRFNDRITEINFGFYSFWMVNV